VTAAFAASAAGLALFVYRCATHHSPIVDLALLRVRSFSMANTAQFLFMVSFGAMLLGNVLFMTSVWGDSILRAGLSLAPGPVMAAVFAVPAGKLGARIGQRWAAGAGCAIFAAGCAWWLAAVEVTPNYATGLLPGLLITGVGVGFTLSNLAQAATSSLPPARFATGSAVLSMARQIGAVVGVAILIAVLGTPSAADPLAAYHGAWAFMVVAAALGSVAALAIGTPKRALVTA
jgi:MFS family permease